MFKGNKDIPAPNQDKLKEAMGWIEDYLKPTGFVAGTESMSVADLSLLATYSSMEQCKNVYINLEDFPESKKWAEKMKKLMPDYEKACGAGAKDFGTFFTTKTDF